MAYSEEWLTGPSSTQFYTRTYAASEPIAVLIFVHGAAEHCGRYTHTHTAFAERGVTVFVYDQRGFGRTALDSEHKSKDSQYGKTCWENQLEDMEWAVSYVHSYYPSLPLFLMGSSMGGGLVLGFATRDSPPPDQDRVGLLAGIIGSAPTIHLTNPPPRFVRWIASQLEKVAPDMLVPKNKTKDLSRNPETNAAYITDPLVGPPGSLRSVGDLISGGEQLLETFYSNWPYGLPLLIIQGTADQASAPDATQAFYDKIHAKDKRIVLYQGACHELHNEPDGVAEKALEDCIAFITSHSRQIHS